MGGSCRTLDPRQTPMTAHAPGPAPQPSSPPPTFEQRVKRFGQEAEDAGQRLGRQGQAAGERWSRDPSVARAGDTIAQVWGLIVLAIGLWFLADVTLGYDMPAIAWADAWPVVLIVLGLAVLVQAMSRR